MPRGPSTRLIAQARAPASLCSADCTACGAADASVGGTARPIAAILAASRMPAVMHATEGLDRQGGTEGTRGKDITTYVLAG